MEAVLQSFLHEKQIETGNYTPYKSIRGRHN